MKKMVWLILIFTLFLLSSCEVNRLGPITTPVSRASSTAPQFSTQTESITTIIPTIWPSGTLSGTNSSSTPTTPLISPDRTTTVSPPEIHPIIHAGPLDDGKSAFSETLFSLPVGQGNIIHYGNERSQLEGPSAFVILPDGTFLIADPVGNRLLQFDGKGTLSKSFDLHALGMKYITDIRIHDDGLFLLDQSHHHLAIYHTTLEGALISVEEIPYNYPIGTSSDLETALQGIAIDCEGNIILEVMEAFSLYRLKDVKIPPKPEDIVHSYICNGQPYGFDGTIPAYSHEREMSVTAGKFVCESSLTIPAGSFRFLNVFPDGGFFIERNDMVTFQPILVDLTVHYIDLNGNQLGLARLPLDDFVYPIKRNIAIDSKGEVYAMIPKEKALDIVHLLFYKELAPLDQAAIAPVVSCYQKP